MIRANIREDIKIMHPEVQGGIIETFEVALKKNISELQVEGEIVRTSLGVMPKITYDFLMFTKNSAILEGVKCASCKKYVIMTSKAVLRQDITICPICGKNIF